MHLLSISFHRQGGTSCLPLQQLLSELIFPSFQLHCSSPPYLYSAYHAPFNKLSSFQLPGPSLFWILFLKLLPLETLKVTVLNLSLFHIDFHIILFNIFLFLLSLANKSFHILTLTLFLFLIPISIYFLLFWYSLSSYLFSQVNNLHSEFSIITFPFPIDCLFKTQVFHYFSYF